MRLPIITSKPKPIEDWDGDLPKLSKDEINYYVSELFEKREKPEVGVKQDDEHKMDNANETLTADESFVAFPPFPKTSPVKTIKSSPVRVLISRFNKPTVICEGRNDVEEYSLFNRFSIPIDNRAIQVSPSNSHDDEGFETELNTPSDESDDEVIEFRSVTPSQADGSPFMDTLDHLLRGKTVKQQNNFLKAMVVDLMQETDQLKESSKKHEEHVQELEEERAIVNREYRNNLYTLLMALKSTTGEDYTIKLPQDTFIPSETVTELVVKNLTKKIELLNIDNTRLEDDNDTQEKTITKLQEQIKEQEAKIEALETQFKGLNSKRFDKVAKLMEQYSAKKAPKQVLSV